MNNQASNIIDDMVETKVTMENNNDFNILVLKPGTLLCNDYNDANYIAKNMKTELLYSIKINKDTYLKLTTEHLNIKDYQDIDVSVITNIIGDEPNYIYEMLYIELHNHSKYQTTENELASLLNIDTNNKVYSNAIILKTHLPSLSTSMIFETVTKDDIYRLLYHRVHTKVVLYRNYEFVQDNVDDLNKFAETFFEGEYYRKVELGFLAHNINIWYVSELGEDDVCGKLLEEKIEKCIIFTMNTNELRGNITLDEVKKIIYLSRKINSFIPNEEYHDKLDNLGRPIIFSKFRLLDEKYDFYTKNQS